MTINLTATSLCILTCAASASTLWWTFQRIYNTIDPVYERVSVTATFAMACLFVALITYVRFVHRVRLGRSMAILLAMTLISTMLAFWFSYFVA